MSNKKKMSNALDNRKTIVIGGAVLAGIALIVLKVVANKPRSKSIPTNKKLGRLARDIELELQAEEIEEHITKQIPIAGQSMDIKVAGLTDSSLTLSAPLGKNSNVHGTAFAGSLYSVGTLASYYLCRSWIEKQGLGGMGLHLVAKSGKVDYMRPIKSDIVATSTLPGEEELKAFIMSISNNGKGFLVVRGEIKLEDGIDKGGVVREGEEEARKVGCSYSIELCCYVPRRRKD